MSTLLRPQNLGAAFRKFATQHGWELSRFERELELAFEPAELIDLMTAFWSATDFDSRSKLAGELGEFGDMLLYQHGGSDGSINVTRQLYRNGRGHQLGVDLLFKRKIPGKAIAIWSKDFPGIESWAKAAKQAIAALRFDPGRSRVAIARIDRF